jgi:dolichol-phosphate mannosyltransferase
MDGHGHGDGARKLSIVLPTYNEHRNLREVVRRLAELLDAALPGGYELIVVDDNSPDETWALAAELTHEFQELRVMRRSERGLASAVLRGWQAARGEVLAVLHADLQHDPEVVLALWNEIERGADLAVASRHMAGGGVNEWALHRRLFSRGAQLLAMLTLPGALGRLSDPMSGFFMVRRHAIAENTMSPLGYKVLMEVLVRCHIGWIAEVPYVFRERVDGASKITGMVVIDFLRHVLRLRLDTLPVGRFLRFCAVGFSGVFVDMGLLYLFSDSHALGWGLTRSKLMAAECAIVNNFLWNDVWTFRDLAGDQTGFRAKLKRFAKFNVICTVGLALNVLLLNAQFNLLGMNRYLANAIAIVVVTLWNFWLNTHLSWRVAEGQNTGRRME